VIVEDGDAVAVAVGEVVNGGDAVGLLVGVLVDEGAGLGLAVLVGDNVLVGIGRDVGVAVLSSKDRRWHASKNGAMNSRPPQCRTCRRNARRLVGWLACWLSAFSL
jgi:hypothetical protein